MGKFCRLRLWTRKRSLLLFSFAILVPALFFYSVAGAVASRDCVSLVEGQSTYNLEGAVSYYEDPSASQSLQDILESRADAWSPLGTAVPSFGFSSSAFWLKFDMCKSQSLNDKAILEVNYPLLDSLTLFGVAGRTVVYNVHTGDSISFAQRPENHRNFLFRLPYREKEDLRFYLRVQTESAIQVPLKLFTSTGYFIHNQRALLVQGAYFGIIMAMMVYNAFLFLTLREWPYFLYVFFTISYFCFQSVYQGFFQQFVSDTVWWQNHSLLVFGFISIFFANLFADSFLQLPASNPPISRILRGIGFVSIPAAALAFSLQSALMVKVMLAFAMSSSLLIMIAGVKLWLIGHLPARIFTVAWSTLLFSFVLTSINKFGLVPRTFWTENIMQIGGVLEVVLLSIALGERINHEKHQRILVEQRLSSSLEEEVRARTLELHQTMEQLESGNTILETQQEKLKSALQEISENHKELEQTYHALQYAQMQLLQAEKMQSVGRLAAGVAHEINTPIQFVGDNGRFILESMADLEKLMRVYERVIEIVATGEDATDLVKEAKAIADEIDLDYLRTEIPQAINQSLEGIDRIANIVRAMKEFSHPGSNEKSPTDLNRAIENTATVCRHEWKYHAELRLDLDPELPLIPCLAGEINQAFLNLIVNAAHTVQYLAKAGSLEKGLIQISTQVEGEYVVVRVRDNGMGIPEAILTKIFEPFFTTKEVGQGTGQGLAIVYSTIVDKHGGTIEVESELGKGTTFIISLPIDKQVQKTI